MGAVKQARALEVEWAVAEKPRTGESESGDRHLVEQREGRLLAAVIDGLGHGAAAGEAAERALAAMAKAPEWRLEDLFERCHAALLGSRGAVMSLAVLDLDQATVTWAGIGNVEGLLMAPAGAGKESLAARSGVVGYEVPALRPTTLPVAPGSSLVLATDGINPGFEAGPRQGEPAEGTAQRILADHSRSDDDALVLVVVTRDGRSLASGT